MRKSLLSSLITLFFAITSLQAAVHYVPDEYFTIQEAIEDCNNGDMIIVSPGTYVENINFLGKNITVSGTDTENRDIVETTIIDGNNAGSVVTFANGETSEAILTGFTITGGSNYEGSGIYCYYASPTITCNIITDNHGQINFVDVISATYGGGIYFYYSNAVLTRNIIKNNSAYYGGGIISYFEEPFISNNIIHGNSAYCGGGIDIRYGGSVINNTIVDNDSFYGDESSIWDSGYGSNLYFRYHSYYSYKMVISNNIICNGKTNYGIYYIEDISGMTIFSYNNVWGNEQGNYYDSQSGETDWTGTNGNISEDPLFLDDYHIGTDSPCYNAGKPSYIPYLWQRDIDGECALMGDCIEIGADEVTGNARPVADAGDDQYFDDIVSNVVLNGTGSYDFDGDNLSWHWEQTDGVSVTLSNPDSAEPNFIPLVKDIYYFQLQVFDGTYYSQTDTVMIVVGNRAPVADAGSDKVCKPGQQVVLTGSSSYDLDPHDVISYNWTQVSGPSGEFQDANSPNAKFIPSITGKYVLQLVVDDGKDSSIPDTVTVYCTFGSMPDDYGYSWIDSDNPWGPAYHWIDIKNSRTKLTDFEGRLEEVLDTVYLVFNFNFYGKTYNKCYIQSSGLISFGSTPITYSNQIIPQDDGYNNAIAWLWTILYPLTDSKIYYKSFGDYFVIQFIDFTTYYDDGIVNAEVILYESGKIVIQFKDFSEGSYNGSYTIGIENSYGTIGTQVAYNDYSYLHDELAIEFSLGGPYEPVARAGSDQQHKVIEQIILDGTGSNDRDPNDVLTYQWTQTGGPFVELSDPTATQPAFIPIVEGEYVFQLVVSDGTYTSYPDEVVVFIGNRPPVANAGKNKACEPNQVTGLDGSESYDLDVTDVLTYSWSQISGPAVNIHNPDTINPYFVPNIRGEYIFELIVSDGIEQSQPDTVIIVCGMGSAPDDFGYHWIDNSGSLGPVFSWIDIRETGTEIKDITYSYEESFGPFPLGFEFNFYDNIYDRFYIQASGSISFDSKPITYNNQNIPKADGYNNLIAWFWTLLYPQNNAKIFYQQFNNYTVVQFVDYNIEYGGTVNAEVIMYASGKIIIQYKDFSDDAYLYQYTIGIENSDGTIGTQVAYDQYNFLHDGLVIELTSGQFLPVARAGEDQYISHPSEITLDGSESYTYNSSGITSYHWRQIEGPVVTLSDPNAVNPTFIPEPESQYVFELIVSDNSYQSEPDEVLINVHNLPPIANAGPGQLIKEIPDSVTLDGRGSYDPLNDALLYHWTQISGSDVELSDSNSSEPNFVPTEYGVYQFELVVSDGYISSSPDTVYIVLDNGFFPVADAGQTVYSDGGSVTLDGTRSNDPDGLPEELIYSWEQISGPSVVITDTNSVKPVVSGITQTDSIQTCEFELVVYDGQYLSFPDTVELKIVPQHTTSPLRIESGAFDPNKPTIVFFNGGDGTYGSGSWSYSSDWLAQCNALCFYDYGPESESSRSYHYHGDILICYLSQIAPYYNKAIQTMGYSTGGQPAMDTAIRMNLTYKDARYAINRVTLLDVCCKDYSQDIIDFLTKPVDGEQSWVDSYIGTIGNYYPGAVGTQTGEDHATPSLWYKNSLSGSDMNKFNGGIISGGYWSVIGPGKNFQLSRTRTNEEIYRFRWNGSQTAGSMAFYNEALYPGRMLGLVNLVDPYDGGDPNGAVLSCMECENAVGYELLIGTDPHRVMDFDVVWDSQEPPDCVVTSLPAEECWWTVRARDEYGSTIFADPVPVNSFMISLPVYNLTTGARYSTIRDAVDKAASGDEILVNPGIYQENVICQEKNVTIRSIDPNDPAVIAETVICGTAGGASVTFTGVIDTNCIIEGITIKGKGNGIYCEEFASPTISKCIIIENSGDGIYLYRGCEPVISECRIMNNGNCGIRMKTLAERTKHYNMPVITNCVIARNMHYGISEGKPTLLNCTIADNLQCGLYNSTAIVANTIIYFNGDGSLAGQVAGDKSIITYSDVQGSWSDTGNIDSDPLFADSINGDYHLMSQTGRWDTVNLIWTQDISSSPCIDAGDPVSDVGLEPAPNGSVINMGAYGGTTFASMSP